MSVTFTKSTTSAVMPDPQLGDVDQQNIKTKFMWSMAGTTYSYIGTPPTQKYILQFNNILRAKVVELIAVLTAARGSTLTYTDYDGATHTVKVLGDPFEYIADSRAHDFDHPTRHEEYHSFRLELEEV
jgi:hypothetical protein